MIKLIIFDLDGVIADLKMSHYYALNKAIELVDPSFVISLQDHIKKYDGLSTKKKLSMLVDLGFPKNKVDFVFDKKQEFTMDMMDYLKPSERLTSLLSFLKKSNYKVFIASNAIKQTIDAALKRLEISDYFDAIYSNEDVKYQKPNPQIYLKAIHDAGLSPKETLIVEDSKHGREAAYLSGAYVCGVDDCEDVTLSKIQKEISTISKIKIPWKDVNLNILIPCAGAGSRFKNAGFKLPKPLIDVNGFPMLKSVVDNINIEANYIFIVQKQHYEEYNLQTMLPLIYKNCKIVLTDGLTEGAACTALLAKEYINNDNHLLIANSDQFVEWDSCDFMYSMLSSNIDGGILTFKDDSKNPKWSFAKINDEGYVCEVAEKNPISDLATVGIYYFSKGKEFVHYAEQMINSKKKVNNEYYVCPIYNEYIKDDKKIKTYNIKKMWGLGIPEDLDFFLKNYRE